MVSVSLCQKKSCGYPFSSAGFLDLQMFQCPSPSENLLYAPPRVIMESSPMYSTVRMMVKESRRITRARAGLAMVVVVDFGGARRIVVGFAPGDVSLKPAQFSLGVLEACESRVNLSRGSFEMSVVAKLVSNASQIILEKKDCIERINPFARRSITSCLILCPEALRETIGMKWIIESWRS